MNMPAVKMDGYRMASARLKWLTRRPMPGIGYHWGVPSYFESHEEEKKQIGVFSLVVVTDGPSDSEGRNNAVVHFLVKNAPHHWIEVGEKFTIAEGRDVNAEGIIDKVLPEEEFDDLLRKYKSAWEKA